MHDAVQAGVRSRTSDVPGLQRAIVEAGNNEVAVIVVAGHADGDSARLGQRRLHHRLLHHVVGVPHAHRAVLARCECCVPARPKIFLSTVQKVGMGRSVSVT